MLSVDAAESELQYRLSEIVRTTPPLMSVLSLARGLCLPDWLVFSGAVAAGSGSPSFSARSTIARVIPPPVDVPKIAIFFGFVVLTTSFHTAIASSNAAGYGKSGGMR